MPVEFRGDTSGQRKHLFADVDTGDAARFTDPTSALSGHDSRPASHVEDPVSRRHLGGVGQRPGEILE
ncbi:MAG TPA: hypothetical protein VMP13_02750 [Acidimicrobiia bacterium]|nr:hypothetical protein [Acidimicrobiia bacterium]